MTPAPRQNPLQRLRAFLWERDWSTDSQYRLARTGRYAYVLVRDLLEGQLSMRAMSLVYTTLLSVVPILALAFSILKALGVHNSLEPLLLELLRPLGSQAYEITDNVIKFIANIQVGVLGSLGVALLFYSAVSMIQKVESSFNFIWRVENGRPLSQRLGEYLAVLTVGPVMVFSALGITATLMSSSLMTQLTAIEPLGFLMHVATRLVPYLLIIAAFTFMYSFVPNTRVRLRSAFAGGLLAGVLWQSGSLIFASFVAGAANYNAIYSGFAIMIFLLIWLYVGWIILLIGCQLAFYHQHPEHLQPLRLTPLLSGRETEYLALMIMAVVGRRFIAGEPAATREELVNALGAAPEHVARVTKSLLDHGLLAETGAPTGLRSAQLVPALDLDSLPLSRLWRLARSGPAPLPKSRDPQAADARRLIEAAEENLDGVSKGITLRQWLTAPQKSGK